MRARGQAPPPSKVVRGGVIPAVGRGGPAASPLNITAGILDVTNFPPSTLLRLCPRFRLTPDVQKRSFLIVQLEPTFQIPVVAPHTCLCESSARTNHQSSLTSQPSPWALRRISNHICYIWVNDPHTIVLVQHTVEYQIYREET